MLSNRNNSASPQTINGVDVKPLYENGGVVNVFEQKNEVHRTHDFKDGFCAPFNTTTLKKLFSLKEEEIKDLKTSKPLPQSTLNEITDEGRAMIDMHKDGENINFAPFQPFYDVTNISMQIIEFNDALASLLKNVQAATITYKTKNGSDHQLAFYRYDSDKCYVMDANRLIGIKTPVDASIKVLIDIIKRSNPTHVEVTSVPISFCINFAENHPVTSRDESNQNMPEMAKALDDEGQQDMFSDALRTVAMRNFIDSFNLTLVKEFVSDYLALFDCNPMTIHMINQALHPLILIVQGNSLKSATAYPIISHLLKRYFDLSDEMINDLTSGIMLITAAITALNKPRELKNVATTMAVGIGAGIAGSALARFGYGLLRYGLFSLASFYQSQPAAESEKDYDADYIEEISIRSRVTEEYRYEIFGGGALLL